MSGNAKRVTEPNSPIRRFRFFRFGLRSALIVLLVAGFFFGWLGREYSAVKGERQVVASLQDYLPDDTDQIHVERVFSFPGQTFLDDDSVATWIRRIPVDGIFTRVIGLRLEVDPNDPPIDLRQLASLRELRLEGVPTQELLAKYPQAFWSFRDSRKSSIDEVDSRPASRLSNIQLPINVRELRLHDFDIKGIERLEKLENLILDRARIEQQPITDLEFLSNLTRLKTLQLSSCNNLTSLSGLENVSQLQKLEVYQSEFESLDQLSRLDELRELDLSACKFPDFAIFEKLFKLEKLTYSHDSERYKPQPESLSNLHSLEELTIWSDKGLGDLEFIGNLPSLKFCSIYFCESGPGTLDGLAGAACLEELHLYDCSGLENLDAVESIKSLRVLTLESCNLSEVDSLKSCTQLTELTLADFTNLTSLNAIKELKNLEVIEINGCTALKDIEPLFHLSNLKSVYLAGSLKIPQWQIDELKKSVPNVETAQRGWGF